MLANKSYLHGRRLVRYDKGNGLAKIPQWRSTMRLIYSVGIFLIICPLGAFAESKEEEVAKYIQDLKSPTPKVRATAAEEIGRIGEVKAVYGKPAVKPLLEIISDKEPQVRAAVA